MFITETYIANLTSMLTVQQLEPTVADVVALLPSNVVVGYCKGSFVSRYVNEVLGFPLNHIQEFSYQKSMQKPSKAMQLLLLFLKFLLPRYSSDSTAKMLRQLGQLLRREWPIQKLTNSANVPNFQAHV